MTITPKPDPSISDSSDHEETKSLKFSSHNSKAIFLEQAGALRDDTSLADLRKAIYQARGRSETDDIVSS